VGALRQLYTALAGMAVSFTGEDGADYTVTAKDLHQLPKRLQTGHLPLRLLLPSEAYDARGGELLAIGAGAEAAAGEVQWVIADLMLWEAAGQRSGLKDIYPDLVRYAGAYAETIMQNRAPVTGVSLISLSIGVGAYEYPLGSGDLWHGVECILLWREILA